MAGPAADQNLTGEQIQNILDHLLFSALEPIVFNCQIFDLEVCYLLSVMTINKKRKICSIDREQAMSSFVEYLATDDLARKYQIITEAKVERSFIHVFLRRVCDRYKDYTKQYRAWYLVQDTVEGTRLDVIARSLGCGSKGQLYNTLTICNDYLQMFYEYRNSVVDHYVKFVSKQAKAYCMANSSNNYDFNDVRQNFLRNVALAIDKYDSSRGALTSYINWWILNAQTCSTSDHEYGIAFTVPQSQKKRVATTGEGAVNFSISLDTALSAMNEDDDDNGLHSMLGSEVNVFEEVAREQDAEIIQYLAKRADIRGCARLSLDIGEVMTRSELDRMKKQMRKEGL